MDVIDRALLCLRHCILASNAQGFGIHSPFLYEFVQQVVCNKHPYYCFSRLDVVAHRFLQKRDLSFVLKNLRLLFRIAVYVRALCVVDMGMSSFFAVSYLGLARRKMQCISWQVTAQRFAKAKQVCDIVGVHNVRFIEEKELNNVFSQLSCLKEFPDMLCFGTSLSEEQLTESVTFCIVHATVGAVFVFENIHSSTIMNNVWNIVCRHDRITAAIDMQYMGVAFTRPDLQKKIYYV